MNVFCNILNVVQECPPFMKKNWDNEVGNVVALRSYPQLQSGLKVS